MKNNNLIIRFAQYYKPHKKLLFLDLLCAFGLAGFDLVLPIISKYLVNDVVINKNIHMLIVLAISLLTIYIMQSGLLYFISYYGHVMGSKIEYDLRNDIFGHIQTLSHSFFDKTQTGQIMSRIVNDLDRLSEFAHHGPEDLFISFVMFGGSLLIMSSYQWKLCLVVFLFLPILIIFSAKRRKAMSGAFSQVRVAMAQINGDLENTLAGIRVVKAFNNEIFEKDKFDVGNQRYRDSMKSSFRIMAEFFTGINFMIGVLNTIVLTYGGYLVITDQMDVGSLIAFLLLVNFFMNPIKKLVNFIDEYQKSMTGFKRFLEIMDTTPDIVDSKDAISVDSIEGEIEFDNVSFMYDNETFKVLDKLNLSIPKGQTLALVGPSGAGKTTISHLIPRFYDVSDGIIKIDGKDIRGIKLSSLRKNIGLVQQQVFLFTGTIKDNIKYGNHGATDEDVISASKKARIHDFIMTLPNGYDSEVGEKGVKLSGGQKQRISIARVFLMNPSILILDEATSALDNETEIQIQEALEELSKDRTTIVIAHRLSTIRNADEIVVLTEDGIEEKGDHATLLERNGLYTKLYNSQFKGFMPDEALQY